MSERAVPFHCPYCGDEDLRPHVATDGTSAHGTWECRSCLRAFSLKMLGLTRPLASRPEREQP
jgi:transposase-like protein